MDYRISDPRIAELLKAKKKELNNAPSSSDSEIKSVNSEIKNKEAKVKDELASRPQNTKKEENFYKKFKSPKEVKKKKKRLKPPSTKDLALVTKQ